MKKIILSIVAIGALVLLPMSVSAQVGNDVNTNGTDDINSTAVDNTIGAKIITPIHVELTSGTLDFGTITTPLAEATVTVYSDGSDRTASDAEIILVGEDGGVPTFTVTGQDGQAFNITLPEDDVVTITGPGDDMSVDGFETNNVATETAAAGSTFEVGATLTVNLGQEAGDYTGKFDVIVSYE